MLAGAQLGITMCSLGLGAVAEPAIAAVIGRLPSVEEYQGYMGEFDAMAGEIYRYLNFHEIEEFQNAASNVIPVTQEA